RDVASDSNRIEGSHKTWNGIQWVKASSLEIQNAQSRDMVLQYNIQIIYSRKLGSSLSQDTFVQSTYGSHHICLLDQTSIILNDCYIHAH
ncbi:hypothetical protein C8R43DRAFT_890564, partial [Mycena crocata]